MNRATYDRPAEAPFTHRLHLSGFVLDLAAGELLDFRSSTGRATKAGARRPARYLARAPGEVVTKEDLMRSVWHDVVVGDGSLGASYFRAFGACLATRPPLGAQRCPARIHAGNRLPAAESDPVTTRKRCS